MTPEVILWTSLIVAIAGCFVLKLVGLSVPESWLAKPKTQSVAAVIPIALLAALVAVQTLSTGTELIIDARLAGIIGGIILLLLRAPFLVVVFGAAAIAAGLRLLGWLP